MTPAERESHIRQLVAEHGIELNLPDKPPMWSLNGRVDTYGSAGGYDIEIVMPHGWTDLAYWIGLHEVGHIAHKHYWKSCPYFGPERQEREAEAWEWALDNALAPPEAETVSAIMRFSLASYGVMPTDPSIPARCQSVIARLGSES